MKLQTLILALATFLGPFLANACDVTVSNSADLKAAISNVGNSDKEICIKKETYIPDPTARDASFNVTIPIRRRL